MNQLNSIIVPGLHPLIVEGARATINEAKARGFIVAIHSGLRTAEDQNKLYSLGRTIVNPDGKSDSKPLGNIITNADAFDSWHNFGLAIDLVFKDSKGNWTWNKTAREWAELGVVGEMFGMEWGGHWTKFPDFPHFQKRGQLKNIYEAKDLLIEKGIEAVWAMVSK